MSYSNFFCFRGCAVEIPSLLAATGPSMSTTIYETQDGLASLIWSRNFLGLSLQACLHRSSTGDYCDDSPLEIQIRPWLLWKRQGTRRFYFKVGLQHRTIDVAWDLSHASFPSAGSPEPCSGFFVAFSIDGEISLVAGDMGDEAERKMKTIYNSPAILISRRECVLLKGDGGRSTYRTSLRIAGKEREIGIEVGGKERHAAGMLVSIDGIKVLQVRPLRWKFRGSELVEIDGEDGRRMLFSWDLHAWLFRCKDNPSSSSAAVFVFCFEGDDGENRVSVEKAIEATGGGGEFVSGHIANNRNWSERSSVGDKCRGDSKKQRKKILLKTSSLSSSSSASSAGSSSVVDWESQEEAEMRRVDGFTLVVHAWRA